MAKKTKQASRAFNEQECKLTARGAAQLKQVRRHIIADPHYATLNDERFLPAVMKGRKLLGVPEGRTPPRVRIYYDDLDLNGWRNGVEIRIEHKPQSISEEFPYKQVIKIGQNTAEDNGLFERLEYPARLKEPVPDLDAVKNGQRKKLREIFGASDLSKVKLYPFIQIVSQRWRIDFHPGGKPGTRIEYAHDLGVGQTCTGYTWKLCEAELELKTGNPAALRKERKRLMDEFRFFAPGLRSKPSAGFDVLAAALSRKEIRKAVRRELEPGSFRLLDPRL